MSERNKKSMNPATPPSRNPLVALERLPGWWLGKADARRMMAREARDLRLHAQAEEHLRAAREYERRAIALVVT